MEQAGINIYNFSDVEKISKNEKYKNLKSVCPYSLEYIPFESIFNSSLLDIDHIVPISRLYDDSFNNKVICYKSVNGNKNNKTAFEFMINNDKFNDFKKFIEHNYTNKSKIKNFYYAHDTYIENGAITLSEKENFTANSLNDTAYITKFLKNHIEPYFSKNSVKTTSGKVTAMIRNLDLGENINMSQVFSDKFFPLYKKNDEDKREYTSKREDNRNHALDALIIALTKDRHIQQLSKCNDIETSSNVKKELKNDILNFFGNKAPLEILNLIASKINETLVFQKRNKYPIFKKSNKNNTISFGIRGEVHGQTVYGKSNKGYNTQKIKITDLKLLDIPNIIDENKQKLFKEITIGFIDTKKLLFEYNKENKKFRFIGNNTFYDFQFNSIKLKVSYTNLHHINKGKYVSKGNVFCCVYKKESKKYKVNKIDLIDFPKIKNDLEGLKLHKSEFIVLGKTKNDIDLMNGNKDFSYYNQLYYITEVSESKIHIKPHYVPNISNITVNNDSIRSKNYYPCSSINSYLKQYGILTKVKVGINGVNPIETIEI